MGEADEGAAFIECDAFRELAPIHLITPKYPLRLIAEWFLCQKSIKSNAGSHVVVSLFKQLRFIFYAVAEVHDIKIVVTKTLFLNQTMTGEVKINFHMSFFIHILRAEMERNEWNNFYGAGRPKPRAKLYHINRGCNAKATNPQEWFLLTEKNENFSHCVLEKTTNKRESLYNEIRRQFSFEMAGDVGGSVAPDWGAVWQARTFVTFDGNKNNTATLFTIRHKMIWNSV